MQMLQLVSLFLFKLGLYLCCYFLFKFFLAQQKKLKNILLIICALVIFFPYAFWLNPDGYLLVIKLLAIIVVIISLLICLFYFLSAKFFKSKNNKKKNYPDFLSKNFTKYNFTKRELEIVQQILAGKSNHKISGNLFISESTVKQHIRHILQKTHTKSRVDLLRLLLQ